MNLIPFERLLVAEIDDDSVVCFWLRESIVFPNTHDLSHCLALMVAAEGRTRSIGWTINDPTGSFDILSWNFVSVKDLPLYLHYKFRWPLFDELLKAGSENMWDIRHTC
jgi:hypothetical protein